MSVAERAILALLMIALLGLGARAEDWTDSFTVTALAVALAAQDRGAEIGPLFEGPAEIDSEASLEHQRIVAAGLVQFGNWLIVESDDENPVSAENYRRAEAALRKALPALERVHGADSVDVAELLCRLGLALFHHGTAVERVEIQERRLAIYERQYGADSARMIGPLFDLATELFWIDQSRAEQLRLQVYEITKQEHGDDPHRMAQACRILESHYKSTRNESAEQVWAARRREYEAMLGTAENVSPLQIANEAIDLEKQGKDEQALARMRQAVEAAREQYESSQVNLYAVLHHAAGLHQRSADLDGAERYLLEAKEHAESIADENAGPLHGVLRALADQYRLRGQLDRSIDYALMALELGRGLSPAEQGTDLNMLADLYSMAGLHAKALDVLLESLEVHEATYGPDSQMTANPLFRLADTQIALGNLDEAEGYLVHTIDLLEAASGPGNPFVKTSKAKLTMVRELRRQH